MFCLRTFIASKSITVVIDGTLGSLREAAIPNRDPLLLYGPAVDCDIMAHLV